MERSLLPPSSKFLPLYMVSLWRYNFDEDITDFSVHFVQSK